MPKKRCASGAEGQQTTTHSRSRSAVETLAWAARSWGEDSDVNATLLDIADSLELKFEEAERARIVGGGR